MNDKKIFELIKKEEARQKKVINLIASENYCSKEVLQALGSVFDNKYAEGYPGARYYKGNVFVDELETLCQNRALKAFGVKEKEWAVNVQPLSGANANLAVYLGLVPKGEKIMGMTLSSGGHLSHGQKVSITGKFWESVPFEVDSKTEVLDYEELKKKALKEKPALIVCGFTAYPRLVDWKKFREIADATGAILMADMSHLAGLVAGKAYPSPFPFVDVVTTTTHKTLRGPRGAMIFSRRDDRELNKKIDKAVFPGLQGGPHESQIAGIAVALEEAGRADFKKYAKQIIKNAKAFSKALQKGGIRVVSGGTDSHMILVDVWQGGKGVPAKEVVDRLEKAGIIANVNTIPGETRSPFDPSGIRFGTAAETTRGKKEKDFQKIAERIIDIISR